MADAAPMPSASVATATSAKPGFFVELTDAHSGCRRAWALRREIRDARFTERRRGTVAAVRSGRGPPRACRARIWPWLRTSTSQIARLAALLKESRRVTVLTGAGVSAASGVPTFRGSGGLWRSYDPMTLATPQAFAKDPVLVWEWYDWRRQMIAAAQPNPAHHVIAEWSRTRPEFTLITQNVDGLHERAGTERVLRLHGSIWEVRCTGTCRSGPRLDERAPLPPADLPPRCADLRRADAARRRLVRRIARSRHRRRRVARDRAVRPLHHHRHVRRGLSGGRLHPRSARQRRHRRRDQSGRDRGVGRRRHLDSRQG